jgi:hypothetical protein
VEVLAFQSGDLVLLVEVGEGGVAAREAEGAGAARDGDVAALGRGEVERGALEAERATVRARGEAGGEEPRERQRAVAHLVHHADAVRAPQHGMIRLANPPARAPTASPFIASRLALVSTAGGRLGNEVNNPGLCT